MKFFVPYAKSEEEALSVINAIAQFIGSPVPEPSQLIYKVSYLHNGELMTATVGEPVDTYYREANPVVIAIFPGSPIKICLADRGVVRGSPIFVSGDSQFITFD